MTLTLFYLLLVWLLATVTMNRFSRRLPSLILVWFILTAALLWPLSRRIMPVARDIYHGPAVQSIIQQGRTELDAEMRREFPEFYSAGEGEEPDPANQDPANQDPANQDSVDRSF